MTERAVQERSGRQRFDIKSEIRIIPWWAFLLAALAFIGIQILFHAYAWPRESRPPHPAFQILVPLFVGLIPAFLALLVGYVNRDAGRRGMSRALWTAIVVLVPNAIGFIIYFLMRTPLRIQCPECATRVDHRANYCPQCRYNFHPTCPQCKAAVRPAHTFCPNCGAQLQPEE